MKLTTRDKVLITIILAILYWWAFGCGQPPQHEPTLPAVDVAHLKQMYGIYNEAYFHGTLTQTPQIDMLGMEHNNWMASTICNNDVNGVGINCTMHFSPHYVVAPRTADETMLHEMCHIKTWMKDMDSLGGQIDHGHNWRACMVGLDMQGAFRQIIIDNYAQEKP